MKKGKDVSAKFGGIYLVHHNFPGMEKEALTFKQHLVFVPLQGEIEITLRQKKLSLGPGKMLYLPPESEHSFASSKHQGERLIALVDNKFWQKKLGRKTSSAILPLSQLTKEILFYLLVHPTTKHSKSLCSVFVETLNDMKTQLKAVEVVKSYFSSLANGDLQTLGSLLAEDIVWHQPGNGELSKTYNGKSEVFGLFGKFMEISQGTFKIDCVDSIMENGPFVAATLHFSAKNKKGEISMNGVDLMRVEHGKIKEVYLFSGDQKTEDAFWVS